MVVYTTLMNVLTRGGQKEQAMRLFRTMETDGVELDVVRQLLFTVNYNQRASGMWCLKYILKELAIKELNCSL